MTHTSLFSSFIRKVLLVLSITALFTGIFLSLSAVTHAGGGGITTNYGPTFTPTQVGVCEATWPSSTTWSIIVDGVLGTLTLSGSTGTLSLSGQGTVTVENVITMDEGISFDVFGKGRFGGTFQSNGSLIGDYALYISTTITSSGTWSASTGNNLCTAAPSGGSGSCTMTWPSVSTWNGESNGNTNVRTFRTDGTGTVLYDVIGVLEKLTDVVVTGSSVSFTRPLQAVAGYPIESGYPGVPGWVGLPATPQYYVGTVNSDNSMSGTFTHPYIGGSTIYTWSADAPAGTLTCVPTVLPKPTSTFSASPTSITGSGNTTLSWSSTDATSCTGTGFNTGGNTSGSASVPVSVSTTYTLNCTGGGGSVAKNATVIVKLAPNVNPTCTAGGDITINTGNSATLSCSATDPDGTIASYSWTFGDGTSSGTQNPTHVYNSAGTYTATCTVTDDRGGKDTDTTIVTVTPPPLGADLIANAPVANGTLEEGSNITFTGITTNQGDTNITATFDNRFQIDVYNDGTYDINMEVLNSITNLNAGSSRNVTSAGLTSLPVGTHSVRYCADLLGNDVTESNENNNCSAKLVFLIAPSSVVVAPSCSLGQSSGRILVDLKARTLWVASGSLSSAQKGPFSANIPKGMYNVTLESFDNHGDKGGQGQTNEQWHLKLNSNGSVIATTGTINDLPDNQDTITQVVNTGFAVSSDVSSVTTMHSFYPGLSGNSIKPLCAAFDPVVVPNGADLIADPANPLFVPSDLVEGDSVTFRGRTTNQGDTDVNAIFDHRFQIDVGNNSGIDYDSNFDKLNSITNLDAGSSKDVTLHTWSNLPAGTHAVRYCVDIPGNDVNESNEDNNCSVELVFEVLPVPNNPQCSDGIDNDGDGKKDFPDDPGCTSGGDDDETNPLPQCSDGIDNDGDGLIDSNSPGCHTDEDPNNPGSYNPGDNDETFIPPQCSDGIDNDGDGKKDFPDDPGCTSGGDDDETSPLTLDFKAIPLVVPSGNNTTLEWNVSNIASCTITGSGVSINIDDTNLIGSRSVGPITRVQTYTLWCEGLDSIPDSDSVTIRVLPSTFEEF